MTKNSKSSLIAAIPAFIILFAVRLMLIAGGTDFDNGFLEDGNGALVNFSYYGLLILTFVMLVVLGIVDKKKQGSLFTNELSGMVDAKAVMVGFPLLMAGALTIYDGYLQTSSLTPSAYVIFVNCVMGALMVILGFVILYKKEITPFIGFTLVVPAVYYTLRGIGVFLDRMVVTAIPEYLIDALSVIGAAVFFMQLAKLLTGNESKTTRVLICATGLTTALMILSSAAAVIAADVFYSDGVGARIVSSRIVAEIEQQKLLSQYTHAYFMSYVSWADVVMAVGMILIVVALHIKNHPSQQDEVTEQE